MPREGSSAPQGRYRMAQHGASSRRGLQGVYILQDNSGCQVWRPTWNMTRTVARLLPVWDPMNPQQLDPFKLSENDRDFGDWIRRYDAVTGLGTPGITYILRDPRETDIDIQQNPAWLLYRGIKSAVDSGQCDPSWNPLIYGGGANRKAPLDSPTDIYVAQCILLEHKSKPCNPPLGMAPEHQQVVLMMSQSAGEALLDKANEEGAPDIITLDGGMFVDFHQLGVPSLLAGAQPMQQQQPQLLGQGTTAGGGHHRGNQPSENRYEVDFLPAYPMPAHIGSPPGLAHMRDQIVAKIRPWDDIIRVPSIEEQVGMIATCGLPPSAVVFALGDLYGEYIPEHIRAAAHQQTAPTQVQGGFQQPQGGAPTGFQPPPTGGAPVQQPPQQQPAQQPTGFQPPAQTNAPPAQPGTTQDPAMPAPGNGAPLLGGAPPAQAPVTQTAPATQAPAAQTPVPSGPPATATASPLGAAGTPAAQAPVAQAPAAQAPTPAPGFDQPTHADPTVAQGAMDALERARQRAREQAGAGS